MDTKEVHPFEQLEAILGYTFQDETLLECALTHPSYIWEKSSSRTKRIGHYRRLELLGDAILDFVVIETLVVYYPDYTVEQINRVREQLVNNRAIAKVTKQLGLANFIQARDDLKRKFRRDPHHKVLADVMEAIIGAIYIDGGIDAVQGFVNSQFISQIRFLEE